MTLSYAALKEQLAASMPLGSDDLNQLSQSFSAFCKPFQTDAAKRVSLEPVPGTCFNWIDDHESRRDKMLLFFHGGGYTILRIISRSLRNLTPL